ncbi:MAG: hypothetical protein OSJ45_03895 [Lachnospiraceae bacterium]|nr:hypothetical protein [Lachnospiraceae bacterium]
MDASIIINICSCILTFVLSAISVVILIVTIRQNSLMLENESRAYIAIYGEITYINAMNFYLIIKNFGKSSAIINSLECDTDLSKFAYVETLVPFSNMENASIAPNQSFRCALQHGLLFLSKIPSINFKVTYTSNDKKYSETFCVNLKALTGLVNATSPSKEKPVKIISYALQDINKRLL